MVEEVKKDSGIKKTEASDKDKDHLKCKLCNYTCKKDALLKKHIRITHQEYKCKVCDMKADNSNELLKHTAKEHSKPEVPQTRDIESQNHLKSMKESEVNKHIGDGEFRCSECERVVSNNDSFDKHVGEHQKKTCKHCAILQYDEK